MVRGLLYRLSALDADAAAAVKVIAYFDGLVEQRVPLPALVRATAVFGECVAGIDDAHQVHCYGSDGKAIDGEERIGSALSRTEEGVRVWLGRPNEHRALDELVLERFSIAARLLQAARRPRVEPSLADPALVELVLAESQAVEDRSRALRLLGFAVHRPMRVMALAAAKIESSAAVLVALRDLKAASVMKAAPIGRAYAVIVQPTSDLAAGLRSTLAARAASQRTQLADVTAGVSSECDGLGAPRAWREAQIALRFAAAGTADAVIVRDELGPLAMLAEVPIEQLRNEPGVLALDEMAATAQGKGDLAVLDAFCRTGSRRRAAAELHLHHSSVNARLAHVEKQLGWTLDLPEDRFRAQLVLYARRLARTSKTEWR